MRSTSQRTFEPIRALLRSSMDWLLALLVRLGRRPLFSTT